MEVTTARPAVPAPSAIQPSLVEKRHVSEVDFSTRPQLANPSTVTSPQPIMANRGLRDTLCQDRDAINGLSVLADGIRHSADEPLSLAE